MEKLQFLWFICEVFKIVENLPPHTAFSSIFLKKICIEVDSHSSNPYYSKVNSPGFLTHYSSFYKRIND